MINMAIVDEHDYKVGWLDPANYSLLAYLIEKPWNHICSMCMGVLFAQLYMFLLKYRRLDAADDETKLREHYWSHKFNTNEFLRIMLALFGGAMWAICFLAGKPVTADPGAWPEWGNVLYFGVTRMIFAFGGFLMIFAVFCSPNNFVKEVMRRPFFRMLGSLCFMGALVTPMCMY